MTDQVYDKVSKFEAMRQDDSLVESLKTVSIQIGNTDDKLKQAIWSEYVESMRLIIVNHSKEIHFFGGSSNWLQWQNAAWIVTMTAQNINVVKELVKECRLKFEQDSVAWTEGETFFV